MVRRHLPISCIALLVLIAPFTINAAQAASCAAVPGGTYNTNIAAHVDYTGLPANVTSGVAAGMDQWNDCMPNNYDWPRFQTNAGEDRINVYFHDATGPEACGSFDLNSGSMCLFSHYEASNGTIVDCDHSEAAIADTVAHELGHYLGLGESSCDGHIMGPLEWDSNGLISTDYDISQEEKDKVDVINTNDQEEFEEDCQGDQGCGNQGGGSPIMIDLDGGWFALTGLQRGVPFDIDADWSDERVSWQARKSGDAFLYRNRYKSEGVDDGSELFGDSTRSLVDGEYKTHGYLVLAEFDLAEFGGNQNGWIDAGDAFFTSLGLWRDINHNGRSEPSELFSLDDAGIVLISYRAQTSSRVDKHGNQFRYISRAWRKERDDLRPIWTTDVFFVVAD